MTDITAPVPNTNGNRLIVGIIIGLLLLLVMGVAIAVVALYMVRRRQAEGKYSTGRKGNGKLHDLGKQASVPCNYLHINANLQS